MNFDVIKKNYQSGLWNLAMLQVAVRKGVITQEEFSVITDAVYESTLTTREEKERYFTSAIQDYLDAKARERNYDDIKTAVTYENSSDETFRREAIALREWRDQVWRTFYTILSDIKMGARQEPENVGEIIVELPIFTWTI